MDGESLERLSGHVVICNASPMVKPIVEQLTAGTTSRPPAVVLIVQDDTLWTDHPEWHPDLREQATFHVVSGCPTDRELLQHVSMNQASAAIILADMSDPGMGDARSLLTAVAIEHENPQVHTVLELIHARNRAFRGTIVNEIVCVGEVAENLITSSCITPFVKNVFRTLLSSDPHTSQVFLPELGPALSGASFRQLARRGIERGMPFAICGFVQRRVTTEGPDDKVSTAALYKRMGVGDELSLKTFVINPRAGYEPGKDTALDEGDQLVVLATAEPDINTLLAE